MKMKKCLAALLTAMLVSGISCSIYADELVEFTGTVDDAYNIDMLDESSGSSEEGYSGEEIFFEEKAFDEEDVLNEEALYEDNAFDEEGLLVKMKS